MDGRRMKTITLPDLLPYPKILKFDDYKKNFNNLLCYIIKPYKLSGISAVVNRAHNNVMIRFSDFDGNQIDINDDKYKTYSEQINKYVNFVADFMKYARILNAQYYFSIDNSEITLVDIRIAPRKFCSHGYVRDFFGRGIKVVEDIIKPFNITDEIVSNISNGIEPFNQRVFIKPTSFKFIVEDVNVIPLYAEVNNAPEPNS